MDGVGLSEDRDGNPVTQANLPNLREISRNYPGTALQAGGLTVGVPWGEVGNSEVGHLAIGSGLVTYQDLPRINMAISSGEFFENKALLEAINHAKENNSAIHLMGLCSDGGVHAHIEHLFSLLRLINEKQFRGQVFIHMFTDGRDAPVKSALTYLSQLQQQIALYNVGAVATISGRYYAMDRDKRAERTQMAFDAIVNGAGQTANSPEEAVQNAYDRNETDEFIKPTIILPEGHVKDGDAVIYFNFRPDRARQLTELFIKSQMKKLYLATMTQYDDNFTLPIVFQPQIVKSPIAKVIADAKLRQLHIAETEKYAHVTYFLNGGTETPFAGEERIVVPSPKVASYDQKPEMSAREITEKFLENLQSKKYDFIALNFANPDMVAHTGNLQASIQAMQVVDECMGKIIKATLAAGGAVVITADHGNAEELINKQTGRVDTEHSVNPVPFWLVTPDNKKASAETRPQNHLESAVGGILPDVAPTILELLGLPIPKEMTGASLLNVIDRLIL